MSGQPLYTVGHSTRTIEELVDLLREHDVERLVDIRRHPSSRRHPHFNREPLAGALESAGLGYRHEERLGGRRGPPDPDSPNDAWRSPGFRAYADHLATPEGRKALKRLEEESRGRTVAVMCAEAVPWRCHRRLVADAMTARDRKVVHILEPGRAELHRLQPEARTGEDGVLVYPARSRQEELFGD